MIVTAPATHIRVDKSGVAWIDDTNVKVIEIIVDHQAYGHSPEEIHLQHTHLSLAQVHAAFGYYFDHQAELEAQMGRRYNSAESLHETAEVPFTRKQLTARLKNK